MRDLFCLFDGCGVPIVGPVGRGRPPKWCSAHRLIVNKRHRDETRDRAGTVCAEKECARPVRAIGICDMHYKRVRRSEGRIAEQPWNDRRRNNHYIRKAKMDATSSEPVAMQAILERDGLNCALCGEPVDFDLRWPNALSQSLDHIYPIALGGKHVPENCQLAHLRCNISKGARVS